MIGLVGGHGVGKDFLASVLVEKFNYARVSLADAIRDAVYKLNPIVDVNQDTGEPKRLRPLVDKFGWDIKRQLPEVRRLLQMMGTEVGRGWDEDFWLDRASGAWGKWDVVVTDTRMTNEIERIRAMGGFIWRIERATFVKDDLKLPEYQHATEMEWLRCMPDVVVKNPGYTQGKMIPNLLQLALDVTDALDMETRGLVYPPMVEAAEKEEAKVATMGPETWARLPGAEYAHEAVEPLPLFRGERKEAAAI